MTTSAAARATRSPAGGAIQADGAGRFRMRGAATMPTVAALRISGLAAFAASSGDITVDLGALTRVDGAGLALLIDWLAWAQSAGRKLQFAALPESLRALARLSDVEPFLLGTQSGGGTSSAGGASASVAASLPP